MFLKGSEILVHIRLIIPHCIHLLRFYHHLVTGAANFYLKKMVPNNLGKII